MSPESPLPPYYTYILATLRVAPDLPSGTEPGNPLRLRFSLTPSLRRVRNPGSHHLDPPVEDRANTAQNDGG